MALTASTAWAYCSASLSGFDRSSKIGQLVKDSQIHFVVTVVIPPRLTEVPVSLPSGIFFGGGIGL